MLGCRTAVSRQEVDDIELFNVPLLQKKVYGNKFKGSIFKCVSVYVSRKESEREKGYLYMCTIMFTCALYPSVLL